MFFAIQILWIISSGFVKLSILAFYLRIFSIVDYVRISAWFLIVIVSGWMVSMSIARGMQCTPVAKIWDDALPGHCLDTVLLYMFGSILDVVADFVVLILPMPAIIQLRLPMSKKIMVVIIFLLGGLYVYHLISPF